MGQRPGLQASPCRPVRVDVAETLFRQNRPSTNPSHYVGPDPLIASRDGMIIPILAHHLRALPGSSRTPGILSAGNHHSRVHRMTSIDPPHLVRPGLRIISRDGMTIAVLAHHFRALPGSSRTPGFCRPENPHSPNNKAHLPQKRMGRHRGSEREANTLGWASRSPQDSCCSLREAPMSSGRNL